jgi:AcrR family transcriptional regulator
MTPANSALSGRQRRPLRRADIVATVLETARRGDLERMTMRGLAGELGVTAMALYAHVADKDDLIDEVIDHVLASEAAPLPPTTEWRAWFTHAAGRLRATLLRYPAVLERYRRRPVGVPAALRRMEVAFEVLGRAGFDDDQCAAAFATVHTYTLGFAALEIGRHEVTRTSRRAHGGLDESSPHYWSAFFRTLPATEFPNLSRVAPDLGSFTEDEQFERGLASVLDGVEAELRPRPKGRRRS